VTRRLKRIAELIRQELGLLIAEGVQDPRVRLVSVTRVEVTLDLMEARVHVSVIGDEARSRTTLRGLERCKRYLRGRLGERVELRRTPALKFILDEGVKKSIRIGEVLDRLARERAEREARDGTPEPDRAAPHDTPTDDAAPQ
jgi:ribosome-binding factor A